MLTRKTINELQLEQDKLDEIIQTNFVKRNNIEKYDFEGSLTRVKIALLVEIGELANELKTFKHGKTQKDINGDKVKEELIDCLHFFLSGSNFFKINFSDYNDEVKDGDDSYNDLLLSLFSETELLPINSFPKEFSEKINEYKNKTVFYSGFIIFEKFCKKMGMDEREVKECYIKKNRINRERQLNKY